MQSGGRWVILTPSAKKKLPSKTPTLLGLNIRKSPHCWPFYLTCWPSKRLLTIKMGRSFHSLYSMYKFISLTPAITRYYCILIYFRHFLLLWILTRVKSYSSSNNLIWVISRVLIGPYLIFCLPTSPVCCSSLGKCTPVKWKLR